jgi:hypothetical protein
MTATAARVWRPSISLRERTSAVSCSVASNTNHKVDGSFACMEACCLLGIPIPNLETVLPILLPATLIDVIGRDSDPAR